MLILELIFLGTVLFFNVDTVGLIFMAFLQQGSELGSEREDISSGEDDDDQVGVAKHYICTLLVET